MILFQRGHLHQIEFVTITIIEHLKLYNKNNNYPFFINICFLLEYKYTNWTIFFLVVMLVWTNVAYINFYN